MANSTALNSNDSQRDDLTIALGYLHLLYWRRVPLPSIYDRFCLSLIDPYICKYNYA